MDDETRIRIAAFNIAARFEGRTYRSYQHDPRGILSYGRFNFSLESGALGNIVDVYVTVSDSPEADALQAYQERIHAADPSLREDTQFRDLLLAAANDPQMQQAQDEEATARHWESLKRLAIMPRGFECPLSWALLFDTGINFGFGDGLLRMAEADLGLNSPADVSASGASEKAIIGTVADHYKQAIERQAASEKRPDLRIRGEFWLALVQQGDWGLEGNDEGHVIVKGRPVQVPTPLQAYFTDSLDPNVFYVTPTAEKVRVREEPGEGQVITMLSPGDLAEVLDP
jgi:hypothetical protein